MQQEHMVHQTRQVTPEMLTAASMLVRVTHQGDASMARALGKAEERLMDLPWTIDCGVLQIASYSRPTDVNCTDGAECTCPTSRGTCYHIACWYILSTIAAAGINPVAPLPLPTVLDEDDLPAGSFLDGPFDFADDIELTAPAPFRLQPARAHVPAEGSDFARAQAAVDELFAA